MNRAAQTAGTTPRLRRGEKALHGTQRPLESGRDTAAWCLRGLSVIDSESFSVLVRLVVDTDILSLVYSALDIILALCRVSFGTWSQREDVPRLVNDRESCHISRSRGLDTSLKTKTHFVTVFSPPPSLLRLSAFSRSQARAHTHDSSV